MLATEFTVVSGQALEDGARQMREILEANALNGRDVAWFGHNQRIDVSLPGGWKVSVIHGAGKDNSDVPRNWTGVLVIVPRGNITVSFKSKSFEEALAAGVDRVSEIVAGLAR